MKKFIALLGAMPEEVSKFVLHLEEKKEHQWNNFTIYEGILEDTPVIVAKSGVGKIMASLFTQYLIDNFDIQQIIFTGLAGAISEKLSIGDILIAKDLVQYDMDVTSLEFKIGQIPFTDIRFIPCDKKLFNIANSYISNEHNVFIGRVLTGDTFVTHTEQKVLNNKFKYLKGDAVEMEGAAVALVAHINNIPCLVIRTISDKIDGSALVDFNDFLPIASDNSFKMIIHILKNLK